MIDIDYVVHTLSGGFDLKIWKHDIRHIMHYSILCTSDDFTVSLNQLNKYRGPSLIFKTYLNIQYIYFYMYVQCDSSIFFLTHSN